MKLLQLLSLVLLILFACSCTETDCIEGSKELSTKYYMNLEEYDKIIINIPGAVVFESIYSDTSVVLTIDDNLLNYISLNVQNSTLIIENSSNSPICPSRLRLNIRSISNLNSIEINGEGTFYSSDSLNFDEFEFIINGSGKADFTKLFANKLFFKVNGSGEFSASGYAENSEYLIEGSGKINMLNTETNHTNAKIIGSGIMQIWANDTLNAEIYGSGKISYTGDAYLNSYIDGTGTIIKK